MPGQRQLRHCRPSGQPQKRGPDVHSSEADRPGMRSTINHHHYTVGLHGWPDAAVFGHAVSHGRVRVPAAALRILSQISLGSSVMIIG